MKKIFTLLCALSLTAGLSMAQVGSDAHYEHATTTTSPTGTNPEMPVLPTGDGDEKGFKEGRVRLNLSPNPMTVRSTLDAGGHTIQRVTISDQNGHMLRLYNDVNDTRLVIVRDDLLPGVHLVQAITTHGSGAIKMMVE